MPSQRTRCVLQQDPDDRESVWAYWSSRATTDHWSSVDLAMTELMGLPGLEARIVGRRDNASLILALLSKQANCRIACPLAFTGELDCRRPGGFGRWAQYVAQAEKLNEKSPRTQLTGGWRPLSCSDRAHYGLVRELDAAEASRERLVACLTGHPASAVLRMLGVFPLLASARLLADILDVRWFRHPERPDRLSRLKLFVGLHAQDAEAYWTKILLQHRDQLNSRMARAKDLVTLWSGGSLGMTEPDELISLSGESERWNFFRERWGQLGSVGVATKAVCHLFLNLLFSGWTDGLYVVEGRRPPPFCIPEDLFGPDPAIARRWAQSLESLPVGA